MAKRGAGGTGKGGTGPRSAAQQEQAKRAGRSGSIRDTQAARGSNAAADRQSRRAVPWSGKGDPF